MCSERTTPRVIKSNYKAAPLNSNSEEMRKLKQNDANMNGLCHNLLGVNHFCDKSLCVFPKQD